MRRSSSSAGRQSEHQPSIPDRTEARCPGLSEASCVHHLNLICVAVREHGVPNLGLRTCRRFGTVRYGNPDSDTDSGADNHPAYD